MNEFLTLETTLPFALAPSQYNPVVHAVLSRLVQESVVSPEEAKELKLLLLQGRVSSVTAVRYLTRIEHMRSTTASERCRHGRICVLGYPVSGSGHVCRTVKV